LMTRIKFGSSTNHEDHHYAVASNTLFPLRPNYFPLG
jgi:hypothetical protein